MYYFIFLHIAMRMEPLGREFEQVLYDNLWDLYGTQSEIEMSCYGQIDYDESEINGTCDECGQPTIDGCAADSCEYSPTECEKCGWSPCDMSC